MARQGGMQAEVLNLPGLRAPVEVSIDRQGIAHIRAGNLHDLFFGQGWNAARDRLWQIDLWRKRGLGLLAADFGPGYLEQDRAARQFLYHGDMAAEWAAYGPDAEAICTAFAAGINARIDQIAAGAAALPVEFTLMDTRPAPWRAEDVVRIRSHCLTRNALSEVLRAHVMARGGARLDALRRSIEPPVAATEVAGLDLASIPLKVLESFALATASVTFGRERLAASLEEAHRWRVVTPLGDVVRAAEAEGSNNWVVAGARTASGRPLMACDPHRLHSLPSLRYVVHLTAPGLDVIGMGEPGVPGISLGHNDRIAWSLTIFGGDQEDVMVHDTDPANPDRYPYKGGWKTIETRPETFAVRGHGTVTQDLRFTCHGPVLHEDRANHRAYSLRTVWTEPGMAPYMASLKVMRARDLAEYQAAIANWGTPSVNHLYADVEGNIAWHGIGATPIRPNWNGLLPVPGDGRFEWAGLVGFDQLPRAVNPDKGFMATANEMNLPEGWVEAGRPAIGHEWVEHSRSDRIHAVLGADPDHDLAAAGRLQNDTVSLVGRRLARVLSGLSLTGAAEEARALLAGWDGDGAGDSAGAALFEVWLSRHLQPALGRALGAAPEVMPLLVPYDNQTVATIMENPAGWLPSGDIAPICAGTLAAAWADAQALLGQDPATWRWDALHGLGLRHALAGLFPEQPNLALSRLNLGGGPSSPNYGPYRAADFGIITGPSVRLLMDVGDWDASLFVGLPGQSGEPDSPHFADLAAAWRDGGYFPLRYSPAAVAEGAETVLKLEPGAA